MGSYLIPSPNYFILSSFLLKLLSPKFKLRSCKLHGTYFNNPSTNPFIFSTFPPKLLFFILIFNLFKLLGSYFNPCANIFKLSAISFYFFFSVSKQEQSNYISFLSGVYLQNIFWTTFLCLILYNPNLLIKNLWKEIFFPSIHFLITHYVFKFPTYANFLSIYNILLI